MNDRRGGPGQANQIVDRNRRRSEQREDTGAGDHPPCLRRPASRPRPLGVVVVEAARKSGSLITARLALEQNREVFAVPGSPLDPRSEGTNALIKQGAVLVTQAEDVLEVLRPITGRAPMRTAEEATGEEPPPSALSAPPGEPTAPARAGILALLGPTPVAIDDLIRLSGSSPAIVHTTLLELELAGRLQRQRGALVALL
jgi:DNA processing protein